MGFPSVTLSVLHSLNFPFYAGLALLCSPALPRYDSTSSSILLAPFFFGTYAIGLQEGEGILDCR